MDIKKIKNRIDIIVSFPITLIFNFYYLPFNQAIKIPIILYKPNLWGLKGKIKIKFKRVYFGMIHLGRRETALFKGCGVWINNKGTIIFRGPAVIGAGSVIQVGKNSILDIGYGVKNSVGLQVDCQYKIKINNGTRLGWNILITDSAMHRTKFLDGTFTGPGYGEVELGKNNWIASKCIILAGSKTPDYCIVSAGSLINKDYSSLESKCLIAGCPAKLKKTGIWRDFDDCDINYKIPSEE